MDISIKQKAPDCPIEEVDLKILRLLLIMPPIEQESKTPLGVSPLLICVSRRARNQLQKKHNIAVEELERESVELFAGLQQFRRLPSEADTQTSAGLYNRLLIAHHEKVQRLGTLLGGQVGQVLRIQALLSVQELSSPL